MMSDWRVLGEFLYTAFFVIVNGKVRRLVGLSSQSASLHTVTM